jgi:Spy/CpxP family protein refolding chaperone
MVILMTIFNLVLIGLFLWKDVFRGQPQRRLPVNAIANPNPKPNPGEPRDLSRILEKELNLSGDQVNQIKKIRRDYIEKEKELEIAIRAERDSMNTVMFTGSLNDELVIALARRIAENEYRMELLRYEQSKEFKSVCTPIQLEKFGSLLKEIKDYFRSDNKSNPGPNPKPKAKPKPEQR